MDASVAGERPERVTPPPAGGEATPPAGRTAAALPPPPGRPSGRPWRPSRAGAVALVIGLIVTVALALISLAIYNSNEKRLLHLRAREVGSVLTAAVPSIQTPLASAAELADATAGNARKFRSFMAPYVGPGRQFISASLWRPGSSRQTPSAVAGLTPILASMPAQARRFFAHVEGSRVLNVVGVLGASTQPSLGYAFSTPGVSKGFAVYAESPLPKNRRSKLEANSAFSDLDYALYLGRSRRPADLLVTDLHRFPIRGRQAADVVPFGDTVFTIVVTPRVPLGGVFFRDLPWIILIVGAMISLAAAVLTDRLARRREYAEQLSVILDQVAAENHQMYTEQRSIAQTLQHALLPDTLPELPGLELSARYVPASSGIDVGGDWYDVVAVDERCVFVVIGDVSGHGLRAATAMASLRHATLAYVAEDARPASVLSKLSALVGSGVRDYFATVLCGLIDVQERRLTLASAGHIAPLLIDGGDSAFVDLDADVPIGVRSDRPYRETVVSVPPKATLIAFTDGLVERRGEVLDAGLTRLRQIAHSGEGALGDLLARLVSDLASDDHHDDTAIVGIRWQQ
jgi:serine phosphatase RsbU (regulator of sigma subunit)